MNIQKIMMIFMALLAILLVGCAQNQAAMMEKTDSAMQKQDNAMMDKDDGAAMTSESDEEHIEMAAIGYGLIGGKMMVLDEIQKIKTSMVQDAILDDGTTVMTNGKVIKKDGSSFMLKEGESMWQDGMFMEAGHMEETSESMMKSSVYTGTLLGGSKTTPYLAFSEADYKKAQSEGKKILLYFYASWCPTCKAEQPEAIGAFNELSDSNLVGFRVNFKDSDTDNIESALAKEFAITYQHTKVIVQDGEVLQKSLASWKKQDYLNALG